MDLSALVRALLHWPIGCAPRIEALPYVYETPIGVWTW